jgi:hypothetical protein
MTRETKQNEQNEHAQSDEQVEALGLEPSGVETATEDAGHAPRSAKARWIRRGIGVALGASAGFAYYSFVGCTSGGCPIWQDPVVSSGFGGLIGVLAIW